AINILNCTVGSGVLALPFALKDCGFGLGLTLSVVVGILCWLALYVLIITGKRIGVYKSIGSLAKASIISVATLPPILLVVAIRGVHYAPKHERSYAFVGDNVFPAIGVMAFAMLCTQTAFLNFQTMKQPTRRAWAQATSLAVFFSWLVSFAFATFGFIAFGFDVEANIFNSFPVTDGMINIGRGLLGFSMFLTFPQAFYPARTALHSTLGHEDNTKIPTDKEHLFTTIGLFIPILICGMLIKDLGLIYQLVGGLCSTFLAYIIPGLCYFLVFWRNEDGTYFSKSPLKDYDGIIGKGETGHQRNDEEEDDSLKEEEEERLLKKKVAAADHKLNQGHEEEAIAVAKTTTPPFAGSRIVSYGAISQSSSPSPFTSTTSFSSGTLPVSTTSSESRVSGTKTRRIGQSSTRRTTDLRMDIGAGILVIFGVFVMVVATTMTLKKMLSAA
ncbi:hypothetical protein BGZ65_010887, partial [Modicella reniformis]